MKLGQCECNISSYKSGDQPTSHSIQQQKLKSSTYIVHEKQFCWVLQPWNLIGIVSGSTILIYAFVHPSAIKDSKKQPEQLNLIAWHDNAYTSLPTSFCTTGSYFFCQPGCQKQWYMNVDSEIAFVLSQQDIFRFLYCHRTSLGSYTVCLGSFPLSQQDIFGFLFSVDRRISLGSFTLLVGGHLWVPLLYIWAPFLCRSRISFGSFPLSYKNILWFLSSPLQVLSLCCLND